MGVSLNKSLFLMFFSVALVFTIIFMSFTPVFAIEEEEEEYQSSFKNTYSAMIAGKIISRFPTTTLTDAFGNERTVIEYPSEWAGAYIDKSNNLHIILTKNVDEETEYDYRKLTNYDESVIFEIGEFSLATLYKIQWVLDGVMVELGIQYTGINEFVNRLEIGVPDETKKEGVIEFLKTTVDGFDERCIMFNDPVEENWSVAPIGPNVHADKFPDSRLIFVIIGLAILFVGVVCVVFIKKNHGKISVGK